MKTEIKDNYRGEIENIEASLSKKDKLVLKNYVRERRTKAGDDKVQHYKTNLLILRDLAEKEFDKFCVKKNNKWNLELVDELLILIKNSDRHPTELLKILKHFVKWYYQDVVLHGIINQKIKIKNQTKKKLCKEDFATDEELEKMFLVCKNLKEKAMLTLQDELGLRPKELLNLKWSDIKFQNE